MKKKLIFILIFLIASLGYSQTDTCGVGWGEIRQISDDSAWSVVPQIFAAGDTVHIVWFNSIIQPFQDSLTGIYYTHSFDGGKTFISQCQLVSFDSARGNPGILAVRENYLYLVYIALVDTPQPYSQVMGLIRSTDAGVTWGDRQLFNDYEPWGITTHDSSVYIYFGYSDDITRRTYSGCMVSNDYGKTFTTVSIGLPRGGGSGYYAVNKLIMSNNYLHYIYEFSLPIWDIGYSEVAYKRSTDFGLTWSVPDTLSVIDSINSQHPRIAGDDYGNLYVVWNDQKYGGDFSGTIVMRRSTDNGITWLPEQVLSQFATAIDADISIMDSLIFVVWDNEPTLNLNSISGRYSRNFCDEWSDIYGISNDSTYSGDPTCSLSKRKIHISWWQYPPNETFYISGDFSSSCFLKPVLNEFTLEQNYPNPASKKTTFDYYIPEHQSHVSIVIYNLLGQEIYTLFKNKEHRKGSYQFIINVENLPTGVYFYRMTSESFSSTKKLILLR